MLASLQKGDNLLCASQMALWRCLKLILHLLGKQDYYDIHLSNDYLGLQIRFSNDH